MKGRDALREMLATGKTATQKPAASIAMRSPGAVKSVGLGLQRLSDEAAAAKSLRATLAAAEQVIEIAPGDVEISAVADRIPISIDPEFESLKNKIREHGQQVPILVRQNPNNPKRFQIAYGRRRLRAAAELGLSVKAIVRPLSETELVIAQGQENSERKDLSFIERAVFASSLDRQQFDRDTDAAALGVDKPEVSRLLGVVGIIDTSLILLIGPAPKVGRPRWLALAEQLKSPGAAQIAKQTAAKPSFQLLESNARFRAILAALQSHTSQKYLSAALSRKQIAWVKRTRNGIQLVSDDSTFASFLETRLPSLLKEFEAHQTGGAVLGERSG